MKLEPGYYKIRKKLAFEKKAMRSNNNTVHLLRVVGIGAKQMAFMDQDLIGQLTSTFTDLQEYEIISKYDREPQIVKAAFKLSFTDASGQKFDWTVLDAWGLRNVFEANPWMKKAFNYKPTKKR